MGCVRSQAIQFRGHLNGGMEAWRGYAPLTVCFENYHDSVAGIRNRSQGR
jgi:hypothetical protein